MTKTAGIIIIGDEILSGKVQDANSFFLAKELRSSGIDVRRISVIPDDISEIAREAKEFSRRFNYVFTSGGIGPTHDDITIEGIAKAFNVNPVIDDHLKELLRKKFRDHLTPEVLKMAEVPEGAELIMDETTLLPLIVFKNIYIFPGIPDLLRKKFLAIANFFDEKPMLLKKVYIKEYEAVAAPLLNEVVKIFQDVKIGSYPVMDNKDYRVMITFESVDEDRLGAAVNSFSNKLAQEKIFRIEG